jgi:hypothetical protein
VVIEGLQRLRNGVVVRIFGEKEKPEKVADATKVTQ